MTRKRRHTNTKGFRAIRRGKTAKEVKEMERKFVKEVKMKDGQTLKAPGSDAGGKRITTEVSTKAGEMSSTKKEKCPHEDSHDGLPCGYCGRTTNRPTVPAGIIDDQKKKVTAEGPETKRLLLAISKAPTYEALAGILKDSLVSVADALKSYANALHKDRHHPLPFPVCQSEECVCGQNVINNAIKVIAASADFEAIEDESKYESDPDLLAHDPDLPAPSEADHE